MLVAGLLLFGLASLASAYVQSPTQLIWARALMGVGAAAVMPSTLSIISNVFDPRERAKAIGVWAGAVGLGAAIGPVVGGALLENFWWGSVFLINVPIIIVGLVAVLAIVPESRDPKPGRVDLMGVGLSIAGLVSLVYGIVDGGEHGFGRPRSWITIVLGLVILAAFVWYERRSDHPSLDVRLFRDPQFSAAVASTGIVFFAAIGTFFFAAFYLQLVRGYTPLQAGLMMLSFAAAQLIFAPRSAAMVKRFGPKAVCAVGLALVTIGLGGFIFVTAETPVWALLVLFFVQGVGMANVMPPVTESVMASLPRERAGVGSAVLNTVRQVGGALGVAVLGSVLAAVYRDRIGDLSALPAPAQAAARESIAGAYGVAERAGPVGTPLIDAANDAFVTAMHWAAAGSAIMAVAGIGVVLAWLPRRSAPFAPPATGADGERVPELAERR
jgi:EmrB/QacA subfamily drug resistance transporter